MKKNPKNLLNGSGQRLWNKAKKIIPGGNQLLSKRAEMFLPEHWPAYYSKARGTHVWDLDGNKFLDMSLMGVGACALGYADPDVNKAVIEAVKRGNMATLNVPEEVELAELLCDIHPWADMVRYARTGGEAMAIAARISRAATGRDTIAFCGYHGWSDWYLATNLKDKNGLNDHLLSGLKPAGVPNNLSGTVLPFHYNKLDELEKIVLETKGKLAAIIMEPIHGVPPEKGFLEGVRNIADQTNAVLVFDEISIGWKMTIGGSHLLFGINPDIAVFAKAMSNGFPMAAIIGREKVMQAAQDTFISSTYWTDLTGPTAALATIKKMKKVNLPKILEHKGKRVKSILEKASIKHNVPLTVAEVPIILAFSFKGSDVKEVKTFFTQEMLKRGILASTVFYGSLTHTQKDFTRYANAVDEVFALIARARQDGGVMKLLEGPVAHSHFGRLT